MSVSKNHPINHDTFLSSVANYDQDLSHGNVAHAHHHSGGGWSTPVFENNLEPFPGAKESSIDLGVFGSVDNHGIFAALKQGSPFNNNIIDVFDGTILAQGNIKHEGFDLKTTDGVSLKNIAPDVGDLSAIQNTGGRGGGG